MGEPQVHGNRRPRRRVGRPMTGAVAVALALGAMTGCGSTTTASPCSKVSQESLDPQSVVHLLPNAPEPDYRSDPPTSGPHSMGPSVTGVVDQPLARPVQVGILERGDVLVQYAPDPQVAAALAPLAGPHVVVAPNPVVDHIEATAWRHRLTCKVVDQPSLDDFITTFADSGSHMGTG